MTSDFDRTVRVGDMLPPSCFTSALGRCTYRLFAITVFRMRLDGVVEHALRSTGVESAHGGSLHSDSARPSPRCSRRACFLE